MTPIFLEQQLVKLRPKGRLNSLVVVLCLQYRQPQKQCSKHHRAKAQSYPVAYTCQMKDGTMPHALNFEHDTLDLWISRM